MKVRTIQSTDKAAAGSKMGGTGGSPGLPIAFSNAPSPRRGDAALLRRRERGSLMMEMLVAIALLTFAVVPIAYSIVNERRMARRYYQRAVAMEIVDGEMEVLAAGEWRHVAGGTHEYPVHAGAATNLPPGQFLVTVQTNKIRFEWQPVKDEGGAVVREVKLP